MIISTCGASSLMNAPTVHPSQTYMSILIFVAILSFVSRVSLCIFKSKPYCFVHLIKPINVAGCEVVGSVEGHSVPAFLLQCDYCHTILRNVKLRYPAFIRISVFPEPDDPYRSVIAVTE